MEKQFWETLGRYSDSEGRVSLFLPHPLLTQEHIQRSIEIFEKTKPSFLIAMSSRGLDAKAIYITSAEHLRRHGDFLADGSNSFVYMLDNEQYNTDKQRELAKKYQDNMKDYDLEFLEGKEITDPVVLRSSRDAPNRIEKLVEIPKGKRILDIGCSSGNVTIRYARKAQPGSYILGVDIDKELIGVANGYLSKESRKVRDITRFVDLPIEEIQEEPESFDTLAATEFFEHILPSEHQRIMEHSLRFLKPNGNMIISVPNRFPNARYEEEKRYRWDWYNHYTHFTKKSLEYFLANYFEEVKFHPVYNEPAEEGIFLIAEGVNKRC